MLLPSQNVVRACTAGTGMVRFNTVASARTADTSSVAGAAADFTAGKAAVTRLHGRVQSDVARDGKFCGGVREHEGSRAKRHCRGERGRLVVRRPGDVRFVKEYEPCSRGRHPLHAGFCVENNGAHRFRGKRK